ncbi:MAG: trehalose-6-phosphate synthase [Phycisphaerales bacterium JB060]
MANRLPVARSEQGAWKLSPGGLVNAMLPVVRGGGGVWIGWGGQIGGRGGELTVDGLEMVDIPLSRREHKRYYCEMANEILWPLFHDGVRNPHYSEDAWEAYKRINERFAREADASTPRGGLVWIHDYHLLMVPGVLRRLRPDVRIGLFLHIPVPPVELFATLPWRGPLVESMIEADLIGTQTEPDAENLRRLLRQTVSDTSARGEGIIADVAAFPISIDTPTYTREAMVGEEDGSVAECRSRFGADRTLYLGVDRLDYTKGIDQRLLAFEKALEMGDLDAREVCFMQIAVPSREAIPNYQEISETVDGLVGRINGLFSSLGDAVVHYAKSSVPFPDLVRLYRAADVMVVTPLRDGMNLVAKEFVATRFDATGELILSEFAGAAQELTQATIVNPHDVPVLADRLVAAHHNRDRSAPNDAMAVMHRHVTEHDVHRWARAFLDRLRHGPALPGMESEQTVAGTPTVRSQRVAPE